jgi:WS/DGAT/MGAT family acyltransferase
LTLADAAWLHLERPENLMMVTGLLLLDRNPNHDRMQQILEERLLCHERFRMVAVDPALGVGLPHWEPAPHFALADHFRYQSLPGADEAALMELAGELMSEPLPRDRPLWDLRVLEDLKDGAAVLVRLHHAIADGIALMRVLLSLAEGSEKPEMSRGEKPSGWDRAKQAAHHFLHEGHDLLSHPSRAVEALAHGWEGTRTLARVLALSPDSDNVLRGPLTVRKMAAVAPPLPVADLKALSRRLGCTINDLLMAVLAGGLGRVLGQRQSLDPDFEVRAVVPVDLRGGKAEDLGNKFGLVFLALPVADPDPRSRLRKIHQRMNELKGSPEALVTFELLSAVGVLPVALEQTIVEWFGNKATAVVTSLHGPDDPLVLGEARLTGLMYWVPQSGRLGLGVSMISYAGFMRVGVASDQGLLPHPEDLVEAFRAAYEEMSSSVEAG